MLRFVAMSAIVAAASASGVYQATGPMALAAPVAMASPAVAVRALAAPVAVKTFAAPVAVKAFAVAAPQHYHVNAAVQSNHFVKHYDVPSSGAISATTIDVPANVLPVNFVFRSASSAINVQQMHQGSQGSFKETSSQDEPHVLKHTVTKPIIQEVREVISPFRRVTQTVEPVREEIQTLVAKGVGATQGQLLAHNMAARPALMAAPVAMAAPIAVARPAIAAYSAPIAAAPIAMAAPALAVARPAVAAYATHATHAAAPAMLGTGLAATYNAGFAAAAPLAMPVDYARPAIATYATAKKL